MAMRTFRSSAKHALFLRFEAKDDNVGEGTEEEAEEKEEENKIHSYSEVIMIIEVKCTF